ncbi:protein takeout-like [Zophobas morio]|uniref:protein takeout-like n=1 Tax=Zophobas morio TaxID=2755281 RepID=UPI003082A835
MSCRSAATPLTRLTRKKSLGFDSGATSYVTPTQLVFKSVAIKFCPEHLAHGNKSDFNPCIAKAVENAISQLNHAIPSVGLIGLEPLEIPFMSIAPGGGPASFSHNYTNLKLSGLTQGKVSKFDVDFDKKNICFVFTVPHLRLDFMYDATGKILVLPIDGHGPGVIDLSDLLLSFTFDLEEYEKNGKKYYKIIGSRLTLEPKLIHYKLDNLFNGDERLGKQINDVYFSVWKGKP